MRACVSACVRAHTHPHQTIQSEPVSVYSAAYSDLRAVSHRLVETALNDPMGDGVSPLLWAIVQEATVAFAKQQHPHKVHLECHTWAEVIVRRWHERRLGGHGQRRWKEEQWMGDSH